jgi:hypothetical protein
MKTIRFYNLLVETTMGVREMLVEFKLSMPENISMNDMFDVLSQRTGFPIESFSYENVC